MKLTELRYQDPATRTYLGSPSIARLENGDLLATHDYFGPGCPRNHEDEEHLTSVYRSADGGATWRNVTHVANAYWSSLFVLGGAVYLFGVSQQYGSIVIRRSEDNGNTWTHPKDGKSGLLFRGGPFHEAPNYHCAPVPILIKNGRLYRAFEDFEPTTANRRWHAPDFLSLVISCPVDADFLDRDAWTMSNKLRFEPSWVPKEWGALKSPGWLEGNVIEAPDGRIVNVLRFNSTPLWDRAAMVQVSDDGRTLSFDPSTGFIVFPGGMSKFTIRRDAQTGRDAPTGCDAPTGRDAPTGQYLTISNGNLDHAHPTNRSVLSLYASADLRHWRHLAILLKDDLSASLEEAFRKTGFQYVDWQFDGDDIIYLVRTAYDGAHNFHDANRIVFFRLRDFRRLVNERTTKARQG